MACRILLTALFLTSWLTYRAYPQSEQLVVNLTSPMTMGFLSFENPKGSVRITGYDGSVILISAVQRFAGEISGEKNRPGIAPKKTFEISARERNNQVSIICISQSKTIDFDIKVPRKFYLKIGSLDNGIVEIINVDGEIEATNPGGDIVLDNIAGSAVLNSVNGKIHASFRSLKQGSPMMFTSLEGNIEVFLPEKSNANLKMRSQNGTLISEFDIKPVKSADAGTKTPAGKVYALGNWTVGILNNGGSELIISTFNGNIYLKKNPGLL